jgi:hypothetical protein
VARASGEDPAFVTALSAPVGAPGRAGDGRAEPSVLRRRRPAPGQWTAPPAGGSAGPAAAAPGVPRAPKLRWKGWRPAPGPGRHAFPESAPPTVRQICRQAAVTHNPPLLGWHPPLRSTGRLAFPPHSETWAIWSHRRFHRASWSPGSGPARSPALPCVPGTSVPASFARSLPAPQGRDGPPGLRSSGSRESTSHTRPLETSASWRRSHRAPPRFRSRRGALSGARTQRPGGWRSKHPPRGTARLVDEPPRRGWRSQAEG